MMEDQVDGMVADEAAAAEAVAAVEAAEAVEAVEVEAVEAVEEEALQVGTNSTPHSQRFEKFLKQMNLEEPMPNGWIKKICTADQVAVMPVNIDLLEKVPNTEGEEGDEAGNGEEVKYFVYSHAAPPQGSLVRDFRKVGSRFNMSKEKRPPMGYAHDARMNACQRMPWGTPMIIP